MWYNCQSAVPFLLAEQETICYLIETDYKGEGLAPERHYAIAVDAFGYGALAPVNDVSDCSKQAALCERYRAEGESCKACFQSLGPGCMEAAESLCAAGQKKFVGKEPAATGDDTDEL